MGMILLKILAIQIQSKTKLSSGVYERDPLDFQQTLLKTTMRENFDPLFGPKTFLLNSRSHGTIDLHVACGFH